MRILILLATLFLFCPAAFCGDIYDAAALGDLKKVEALLKVDPTLVNAKDDDGMTPLHYAVAHSGHKDIVEFLLANKAEVNAKDKSGRTPLHYAAGQGRKDMTELLLANRADINAKDRDGKTALAVALENRAYYDAIYPGFFMLAKENPKGLIDWSVWRGWQARNRFLNPLDEIIALLRKHGAVEGGGSVGVEESGVSESRMMWALMAGVVVLGAGALWFVARRRREQSGSQESRV